MKAWVFITWNLRNNLRIHKLNYIYFSEVKNLYAIEPFLNGLVPLSCTGLTSQTQKFEMQ